MLVIHPDLFPAPMQPLGPSLIKWSRKVLRGKMNIGGIELPSALTATTTVTNHPRSADVTAPTCLIPLWATTLLGF